MIISIPSDDIKSHKDLNIKLNRENGFTDHKDVYAEEYGITNISKSQNFEISKIFTPTFNADVRTTTRT